MYGLGKLEDQPSPGFIHCTAELESQHLDIHNCVHRLEMGRIPKLEGTQGSSNPSYSEGNRTEWSTTTETTRDLSFSSDSCTHQQESWSDP